MLLIKGLVFFYAKPEFMTKRCHQQGGVNDKGEVHLNTQDPGGNITVPNREHFKWKKLQCNPTSGFKLVV